jgi:two-component system, NtrC family, nitrogen regulation sensor histidine kinase NtrY
MFKKIAEKFKGDRKYFSIVFFVLILLAVSGIITDSLINRNKENWDSILINKISRIQESIQEDFKLKQEELLKKLNIVRQDLRNSLQPENESYKELVKLINDEAFENYSIEVFAPNGKLIAWNQAIAINQDELFPLSFPLGETYFLSNDLLTYLSVIDTAHIESDVFYLGISTTIEENIKLNNQYARHISFKNDLKAKNDVDLTIDYTPYNEKSRDGRLYSFELINSKENKIGLVSFQKPLLSLSINQIKETSSKIQSLLVVIALLFVGLGLNTDFKKLNSYIFRFILVLIYLVVLRALIFVFGFPSNLISGPLTDPSFFSSSFGWGIVKSPIEFLTTISFVVLIAIQFFRYTRNYLQNDREKKYSKLFIVVSLLFSVIIFLLIRGLSASIKSVVFDSTIRYFKEPNILPDLPSLVMNLNMLLLGFAVILLIVGFINLIFKYLNFSTGKFNLTYFISISILITLIQVITFYVGENPLITIILLLLITVLVFVLYYQIIIKSKKSAYIYLYVLLISSVISISLLNFFNTKLERDSLKTTALEINRADMNLLSFMVEESLRGIQNQKNITDVFGNRYTNYDALAFKIWAQSSMQRESLNSGIRFYDKNKKVVGEYSLGLSPDDEVFKSLSPDQIVNVMEFKSEKNEQKYFAGIIKIEERGITQGYISAFVNFDIKTIGAANFPDFIKSNLSILNRVIDVKNLKIFQFKDEKLEQVFGDIYPSRDQIKQILNTKIDSVYNDAWLKLRFDNIGYETYLLRTVEEEKEVYTTVAIEEKAFSWNLFNFFKIFIVHSLFIVVAFLLILTIRVRKLNPSFKSKLLIAFLIISIIPVVVLALYNTKIVGERTKEGVLNELSQRANYIEMHIKNQLERNKNRDVFTAAENASRELGISFAIHKGTDQLYNSQAIYDKIGLFSTKLNPQAYYHLNYLRYQEFITAEKINDYAYDSYFKFLQLNDEDYILSVNDAFNKIKTSLTTTEINVVIFGIYSFAVIIIIVISTIFANQISQPIQRLTEATDAVSKGDLNVKIDHNERGELKDLLDGFNQMTSELKKNQIELAEMEREAAWKEMAKQVAHEIKNPLTPMKLALQQLIISYKDKSKDFDRLFEKVSGTVLNQIDTLNQIASEFSRFAKMPSLKIETIDILSVLNDTVNMFMHEKTSLQINTDLSTAVIDADFSQLRRMFINLIRNSMQANADKIIIELIKNESMYKILFSDNGSGIPENQKDRIFDDNFTTKKQGMGLGLSLAKRFTTSINGEIKLQNSSANGTTFVITFPIKQNAVS